MNISPVSMNTKNSYPNFKGVQNALPKVVNAVPKAVAAAKSESAVSKVWDNFIDNVVVKHIVTPALNSKWMGKLMEKVGDSKTMASHMATAGSIVTTSVYAQQTLKKLNKDEEQKKRARTLALNQWMVTGLSTLGAYTINGSLDKMSKKLGYKFREVNQGNSKLPSRIEGFNTAKQLLIFTMMYRYVAPVLVTPLASKISKVVENHKASKKALHNVEVNQQNIASADKK